MKKMFFLIGALLFFTVNNTFAQEEEGSGAGGSDKAFWEMMDASPDKQSATEKDEKKSSETDAEKKAEPSVAEQAAPAAPVVSEEKSAKAGQNTGKATLILLNRRSDERQILKLGVGKEKKYREISVSVKKCYKDFGGVVDNDVAFLQIKEGTGAILFSGWMYNKFPGASAMDHPVYDVSLSSCD